ncbi:Cysteine/Histidine-rich C1 domain family protein [Thalictrum thalictroides]|uniref:Cysteine/Histidine-rich C1 domain family protein n=1 Tax=Thalictrum thalictroides TaxID=46969 RepID=A0A7J6WXX3_THATH|nr:Cysteine/Histidine-rich C1 domain family protein [Thalictrum thalictroides]
MDIPTTPRSITGQEIIHFSHPQHHLVQVTFPYIFTCIGCKEYGAGKRFKCESCDLDLHDFCALAPPSIQRHPFHSHHQLVFYTKQGNGFLRSRCDICAKATRGYVFKCSQCNFEMHPSCAKLSQEMSFPVHQHVLNLLPMTTLANSSESSFVCGECKRKRLGRVYACKVCDFHLHAVCAKGMINGLYANGIKPPRNQSMLGAAAKIASHVIMGFIGGLIEGIGEGVGEVLVENIGRGNSGSRRRTK